MWQQRFHEKRGWLPLRRATTLLHKDTIMRLHLRMISTSPSPLSGHCRLLAHDQLSVSSCEVFWRVGGKHCLQSRTSPARPYRYWMDMTRISRLLTDGQGGDSPLESVRHLEFSLLLTYLFQEFLKATISILERQMRFDQSATSHETTFMKLPLAAHCHADKPCGGCLGFPLDEFSIMHGRMDLCENRS